MEKREWIAFLKNRWGMPAFFYLVLLTGLMIYLALQNGPAYERFLRGRPASYLSLLSLAVMYVICYVSYSKIFKLKAFLLGHLFFATGLITAFLPFFMPKMLSGLKETTALRVIILGMSFNLLMVSLAPVKLRYSVTRLIAVIVMAGELVLCFIVFRNAQAAAASSALLANDGFLWAVSLMNASVILLSLILAKEDNSFGGVLAALALIIVLMAYGLASGQLLITRFMFFILPLLVLTGVVVYWFTCLHHRVSYDPLLQIYNRDYAHSIIAGTSRVALGRPYSIAMVDIDHFKLVNDTYGHPVGDQVLYGTAQCIRQHAMPNGIACRYGGEEIIVFFRNFSRDEAFVACENIRRNVRKARYAVGDKEIAVSVSIGFTACDDPDIPVERVVKSADDAVYTAKETGRNRVVPGTVKKRIHDPLRRTYLYMKSLGRERRRPGEE